MITNTINKKKYIGQTILLSSNGLKRGSQKRMYEHIREASNNIKGCTALNNAIRKYGSTNFNIETLLICDRNMLDYYEEKFILLYNTLAPSGYNIQTGGREGKHCNESKERMSLSKMGDKNPNYGKERDIKTKIKISLKKKGNKHHFYGKTLTEDHKKKLSISHKKYDKTLPMYMIYIKSRPQYYCDGGYAIINHPLGKNKYFTSKKFSLDEKYNMSIKYLSELNNL